MRPNVVVTVTCPNPPAILLVNGWDMVCVCWCIPCPPQCFLMFTTPLLFSRDQAFSRQKCNCDEPISGQWRSKYIFSSSSPPPPHCLLMKLLCSKFSRHARSEWRNARLCNSLPGYYEASRTKPLPSLLLFLGSPPTITHRNRKKGLIMSVTVGRLQSLLLHFTSCIMLWMQNSECKRMWAEEKWACPGTLLLARQFGSSWSKILLSVNKTWAYISFISQPSSTSSLQCRRRIMNLRHVIVHQSHLTQHIIRLAATQLHSSAGMHPSPCLH